MSESVTIKIPIPPSVNHAYKNAPYSTTNGWGERIVRQARVLTDEAQIWMNTAGMVARVAARREGWKIRESKVVLELEVVWPDRRRRDIHNLHKLIGDVLEGIVVTDDRYLLIRDVDFEVDARESGLWVRWYDKDVSEPGLRARGGKDDTRAV